MMQPKTDPQFKLFVAKVAIVAAIAAIASWAVQLGSIHSNTPIIGGQWFTTLVWIVRGLSVVGGISVVAVFIDKAATSINKFLKGRQQVISAKLKNDKLKQEVTLIPQVIQNGIERGFNVDYGGVKVSNPIERINERVNYNQPKDEPNDHPPEPYKLIDAISDYEPSEKGIILGKSNKELITLPLGDQICHIAEASKTGSGKTQLNRSIAAQLLHAEQAVYLLDPFFQDVRVNWSTGQKYDYRPFIPKLAGLGNDVDSCVAFLERAYDSAKRRQSIPRSRLVRMPREYYVIDEVPYLASENKQVMVYINTLVRVGRNFMIYLIIAAQDWQNSTFGVDSGAFRGNFITNFFGDGDAATARALLGIKSGHVMPNMNGIGRNGSWLLKADSYSSAPVKIRTPLADNEAIYQLLGRPEKPLEDIPVEEYTDAIAMEPLMPIIPAKNLSDLDKVRAACAEIEGRGEKPSRRNVAEITGFGASKAGDLINELRKVG